MMTASNDVMTVAPQKLIKVIHHCDEMSVHLGEFFERARFALPRRRLSQCAHPAVQALAHLPNSEGAK